MQKYDIPYRIIEGTDPKNHDIRVGFFQYAGFILFRYYNIERCGGKREYPLVFIKRQTGTVEFVGNWDRVQKILDAEDNSEEFLKSHPKLTTFPRLFKR